MSNIEYILLPGFIKIEPSTCLALYNAGFDVDYFAMAQEITHETDLCTIIFRFFMKEGKLYNVNLDGSEECLIEDPGKYFREIPLETQIHKAEYDAILEHCPEVLL